MAKALFLDRDGVINIEKDGSYIFSKDEFQFYDGVLPALEKATAAFDYIFVVTNQRGVGRGMMTEDALTLIHDYMHAEVKKAGGRFDAIYYAIATDSNHSHRKPNIGMALEAQKKYPDINFAESVMVGNNLSDMEFGKRMGMNTVFLSTTQSAFVLPHALIDEQYSSLYDWVQAKL